MTESTFYIKNLMKEIIKVQIATIKDIHYNFGISTTNL